MFKVGDIVLSIENSKEICYRVIYVNDDNTVNLETLKDKLRYRNVSTHILKPAFTMEWN
jgi:hypothetical protein